MLSKAQRVIVQAVFIALTAAGTLCAIVAVEHDAQEREAEDRARAVELGVDVSDPAWRRILDTAEDLRIEHEAQRIAEATK